MLQKLLPISDTKKKGKSLYFYPAKILSYPNTDVFKMVLEIVMSWKFTQILLVIFYK